MTSIQDLFSLNGKVALVTGGYGGIGQAVTRALAASGARIAVAGHNLASARQFAAELATDGIEALALEFEATSPGASNVMVDAVVERFGRVDILINTVGLNREQNVMDVTEDQFSHVFHVNVKSAMFQSQAVARHMIRQGTGGKIVHFGSVRSMLALRGRGYAAYCAAKGGLVVLARQLAAELAPHRINVNVIAPTFVRTEQVAAMLSDQKFLRGLEARIPLGRIGEPGDMIGGVLYLASPASDFVTGQTLYIDGGITATQ